MWCQRLILYLPHSQANTNKTSDKRFMSGRIKGFCSSEASGKCDSARRTDVRARLMAAASDVIAPKSTNSVMLLPSVFLVAHTTTDIKSRSASAAVMAQMSLKADEICFKSHDTDSCDSACARTRACATSAMARSIKPKNTISFDVLSTRTLRHVVCPSSPDPVVIGIYFLHQKAALSGG